MLKMQFMYCIDFLAKVAADGCLQKVKFLHLMRNPNITKPSGRTFFQT